MSTSTAKRRVFIFGLDGTDWEVLQPLFDQGLLPNLAALVKGGAHARLRSTYPPMSPQAWTSFMTGKNPGKHGVPDFTARKPGSYEVEFVNARFRKATTLWRLASDAGLRVCAIGVPMSFPPEKLNGVQIAGIDTPGIAGGLAEPTGMYPPELHAELMEKLGGYLVSPSLKGHAASASADEVVEAAYVSVDRKMQTAQYLYGKEPWDLFMITVGETDAISHRLWHFHDKASPMGNEASRSYAGVSPVQRIYERIDGHIGKLRAMIGDDTTVFVMSDHGHAGNGNKIVRLNAWLEEQGFLHFNRSLGRRTRVAALAFAKKIARKNIIPLKYRQMLFRRTKLGHKVESQLRFSGLDWSRTSAYSEETPYYPTIWINVRGRDPEGTVEAGAEYDRLCDEIAARLLTWRDPVHGGALIKKVHRRNELYSGPHLDRFPDLILEWNLDGDYSYLFGITSPGNPRPLVAVVNDKERASAKSGDHRDDGILVANGPLVKPGLVNGPSLAPNIIDVAPSVLYALGLPVPEDMDGRVLTSLFRDDFVRGERIQQSGGGSEQEAEFGEGGEYSDEEQEAVRKRLQDLGYVE